jgi:hypothetical protein
MERKRKILLAVLIIAIAAAYPTIQLVHAMLTVTITNSGTVIGG